MGKLETFPGLPPMPAVSRILAQFDRQKLGAAIEVMIALLDMTEPDADAEGSTWPEDLRAVDREHQPDDTEAVGDEDDAAWIDWHRLPGSVKRAGGHGGTFHEDDEDDDPDHALDEGEPDYARRRQGPGDGPGCAISDTGFCTAGDDRVFGGAARSTVATLIDDLPGDADDAEHWQQTSNVPMPTVISADHNIFTDARLELGIANLQTSFRTNGGQVRSADSGRLHRSTWRDEAKPGSPV